MSNRFSKINLYRDKSHKDYGQKQAGIFDWRQLTNIINKDSVLLGNDVEIGYNETGLPGNKTEFAYYLKGYVDFSWKVVMKNEQNNELKKAFEDFRKDLMVEIKDEIQQSETRIKSFVKEQIDNHVQEYHK